MAEKTSPTLAVPNDSFVRLKTLLEDFIKYMASLIKKTFRTTEEPALCPKQPALERAHRTIRMAANYGDSFADIARRIREESERYAAYKKNPEPIGRISLNIKQLDSKETEQEFYEVKDPAEGKASVSYTHPSSSDTVLEFVLHDKNDRPLFPVARTYTDFIGCKEIDLGGDLAFFLNMVEDETPGRVAVLAGFKTKQSAVPMLTFDTPSRGRKGKVGNGWKLKKLLPLGSHLAVVLVGLLLFKLVVDRTLVGAQNVSHAVKSQSEKTVATPQITSIVWTHVKPSFVNFDHNGLTLDGEPTGPRKDRLESYSKRLAPISTFAVSVDSASLDESVKCGKELITRLQKNVEDELKNPAESLNKSNCGSTVKFIVSFEPIEQKQDNFFVTFGDGKDPLFDNEYKIAADEPSGDADEIANLLFRIFTGQTDPKSGSEGKGSEVAMSE